MIQIGCKSVFENHYSLCCCFYLFMWNLQDFKIHVFSFYSPWWPFIKSMCDSDQISFVTQKKSDQVSRKEKTDFYFIYLSIYCLPPCKEECELSRTLVFVLQFFKKKVLMFTAGWQHSPTLKQ